MASIDTSTREPRSQKLRKRYVLAFAFTATIFVSASLLFFVQPLFAKLVLPQIGGAPAVWTTAMLFFQVVLLGGYLYAHLLTRHVPLRWQMLVHIGFWAVALFFLPLSVSPDWVYDPQASTTWQTLTLFAVGVGIPFAMLSANAPLLQSWYSKSTGPSAHDPYFLYGASNTGSLLALLGFPLIAEPLFGAGEIGLGWMAVFIAFGVLLAASGLLALRNRADRQPVKHDQSARTKLKATVIGTWLFLAFVPSTLMLAITTKVSTDLGSFPLIWAVPLAIYILSFVTTFTNRPLISDSMMKPLAVIAVASMAVLMSHQVSGLATWVSALLFAPALFVTATVAHRTLYNLRPDATHLTVFYIAMSVGGALGGLFNSIIAPALFSGIHEGWVSVIFAAAVGLVGLRTVSVRPVAYGIAIAAVFLTLFGILRTQTEASTLVALIAIVAFVAALVTVTRSPVGVFAAVVVFLVTDVVSVRENYLFKDRSFFGAHTVYDKDGLRVYGNGTTIHGYQYVAETGGRPTPLSYYHPKSPMAEVLTTSAGIENARVGIVGLGVGSLACYATPGQSWEFYEIDDMVDRVARDPSMFNFMSHCAPGSETHLGDARIVLEKQDYTFDIMVLDAYSSDSIPVHLLTVEAVEMYLERLATDGQLVFHISNRYYDLSQPLARIAETLGLQAAIRIDAPDSDLIHGGKPSVVMVLTPSPDRHASILEDGRWSAVASDGQAAWTDDRAHLLSALK